MLSRLTRLGRAMNLNYEIMFLALALAVLALMDCQTVSVNNSNFDVLRCSIELLNIGLDIGLLHCIIRRILAEDQLEILLAEIQPKTNSAS
jgi:hypothetical protein